MQNPGRFSVERVARSCDCTAQEQAPELRVTPQQSCWPNVANSMSAGLVQVLFVSARSPPFTSLLTIRSTRSLVVSDDFGWRRGR